MRIESIEISNYRKLRAVRVELSKETTLFVGANNSGKTSVMLAMDQFLRRRGGLSAHDVSACHWGTINAIGERWLTAPDAPPEATDWTSVLPTLDLWLHVEDGEFHRVSALIPTFDWTGGLLGARLRFEPKKLEDLHRDFLDHAQRSRDLCTKAKKRSRGSAPKRIWPESMMAFLERKLAQHFAIRTYLLEPKKYAAPERGVARPQSLPTAAVPVEGDPLKGLLRVAMISAQRGHEDADAGRSGDDIEAGGSRKKLSTMLGGYYKKVLDPDVGLEEKDLDALGAIEDAQTAFDGRLGRAFERPFSQLERLGYPGVASLRPKVATRLRLTDGLNHEAALGYQLREPTSADEIPPTLPEDYNGLGYQNLIAMVFRLMTFRDLWMREGRSDKAGLDANAIEPLHLVLVEEPEAHLHAQVQHVFIREAHRVLRDHHQLGNSPDFTTHLVVSTHSSHVAHALPYANLRYFRREPSTPQDPIPFSTVVNLSGVFGDGDETARFVTRYLKVSHSDLFFADAAVLLEGAAERILVPRFIQATCQNYLNSCYISLLEVGGSHAFRLQPLIEALGLTTLIVTDLDPQKPPNGKHEPPSRGKGLVTANPTLRKWVPGSILIDTLLDVDDAGRTAGGGSVSSKLVHVVYPREGAYGPDGAQHLLIPYTFEDSLILENLDLFGGLDPSCGGPLGAAVKAVKEQSRDIQGLTKHLQEDWLQDCEKARFALDVLQIAPDAELATLQVPRYIAEGLSWLDRRLRELRGATLGTSGLGGGAL